MTVYLVGAGPGDPGLLTVRGREVLEQAEVVVYDRLAPAALLDLAPPDAQRVDVGKSPGEPGLTQAEINALLVDHGRAGRTVVRLKGGDPFVFGRGGEEAEALIDAEVAFEVVPGVTSAVAAPAYAGIPVTHRGMSAQVTIVTGHEDPTKDQADVDWESLAVTGGTLVVLMGVGRLREITDRLISGGRSPDTPAAAVRWGTVPRQRTVRATLETLADADVEAPSALVIGDVARLDLAWFEKRPLFGRRIVVTRAREQASALRVRLEELGSQVFELPAISVRTLRFEVPDLGRYAWVIFTSVNGVDAFFDRGLAPRGLDARALARARVAAIGPGTAKSLEARGIRCDLVPDRYVAEALLDAVPAARNDERILIPRAAVARDVLPEGLRARGYDVDVLPVYETVQGDPDPDIVERVRGGRVDAVTFTSSSTVANLHDLLGVVPDPQPPAVAIGPITAGTAEARGWRVDAVAETHTIEGLVAAVVDFFESATGA